MGPIRDGEPTLRGAFLNECSTTAGALAADRATTVLPVFAAEIVFIAVFLINLFRLRSGDGGRLPSTTHANIEMHSIAFSTLFFWLIPIVGTAAVIGTSQTQKAIPRILNRYLRDLRNAGISAIPRDFDVQKHHPVDRWMNSMYLWQPLAPTWKGRYRVARESRDLEAEHCRNSLRRRLLKRWPVLYMALPLLTFAAAILTGVLMSYLVPPRGWRCRTNGEMYFAYGWLSSYLLSKTITYVPMPARLYAILQNSMDETKSSHRESVPRSGRFFLMLLKDGLATGAVIWWIYKTQIGYYNRPACYMGDNTGLVLPEQPDAYNDLQSGLLVGGKFVDILGIGLTIQVILVPGLILTFYWSAIKTFVQEDGDRV